MAELTPYRKIAAAALYEWYYKWNEGMSDMTDAQKQALAMRNAAAWSFDKLENEGEPDKGVYGVGASRSILSAVNGIADYYDLTGRERRALAYACLSGEPLSVEEKALFASIGKRIKTQAAEKKDKYFMIFTVLSAVHDGWVEDNAKKFDRKEGKTRYMHLPVELIGWEESKKDLLFISPILEEMGISIDEAKLQRAYVKMVKYFLEDTKIGNSKSALSDYILRGKAVYPFLTQGVNTAPSREVADQMVGQVVARLPEEVKTHGTSNENIPV